MNKHSVKLESSQFAFIVKSKIICTLPTGPRCLLRNLHKEETQSAAVSDIMFELVASVSGGHTLLSLSSIGTR